MWPWVRNILTACTVCLVSVLAVIGVATVGTAIDLYLYRLVREAVNDAIRTHNADWFAVRHRDPVTVAERSLEHDAGLLESLPHSSFTLEGGGVAGGQGMYLHDLGRLPE
jgi:hypothetical protein